MATRDECVVGSIPPTGTTVKHSTGMSTMDLVNRIGSLWEAHKKSDVSGKMGMGDLMRSCTSEGEKHFKSIILQRFGKEVLGQLVKFAWVADRWQDKDKRSKAMAERRPWSWFRDNGPDGEPVRPRPGVVQTFEEKRTTISPEGEWRFQGLSVNAREGRVVVSRERMERILRAEGWEKRSAL